MVYRWRRRFSAVSSSFSYASVCIFLTFVKVIPCLSLLVHSISLLPFFFFFVVLSTSILHSLPFIFYNECMLLYVIHFSVFPTCALSYEGNMNQTIGNSHLNILSNRTSSTRLEKGFSYLRIAFQGMLSMLQRMMYVRGQYVSEERCIAPQV